MPRLLPLALVLVATVPVATASASTVSLREIRGDRYTSGDARVTFTANAGEQNSVAVARDGATLLVRDAGAPLIAGTGCATFDLHTARCSSSLPISFADIELGDLDDTFNGAADARYLAATVSGGDGADTLQGPGTLHGGPGDDTLIGSALSDSMSGGAGDDVLRGLGGDDTLSGDVDGSDPGDPPPGNDRIDGGDGADFVSYASRAAGVAVDLADPAPDGGPGERDTLAGIENVEGGKGADALSGDAGSNRLNGGDGADVLRGRGGDDKLNGGDGVDELYGGDGADNLTALTAGDRAFGEAGNDSLTAGTGALLDGGAGDDAFGTGLGASYSPPVCGAGRDGLALAPQKSERIGFDCEEVHFGVFDMFQIATAPARRARGVLSLPARCNKLAAPLSKCEGRVTARLRRPGRKALTLGTRSFDIAMQTSGFVRLQVRRAARRALAQARRPLLDIKVKLIAFGRKITGPGGVDQTPRLTGRWTVRLP